MKTKLQVEVIPVVTADGKDALDALLDVLADAIAVRCIEQARQEVAEELGVPPESLDRDPFGPWSRLGLSVPVGVGARR